MADPLRPDPVGARLAGHDLTRIADMLHTTSLLLAFEHGPHPQIEQIERLATACRGLSARLVPRADAPEAPDLCLVVTDLTQRLAAWLDPAVRLEVEVSDAPQRVRARAAQIEEVVLALISNAQAASTGGGVIRVQVAPAPDGAAARLTVADDGVGMDAATRKHAFDPFFSTTGGVGLGLVGVEAIMAAIRGPLAVESAPGAGTRITCDWPLLPDAHDTVVHPDTGCAILLVEADQAVRAALASVLRGAGHVVTSAASVHHAQSWLDRGGAVELIVTDTPFEAGRPQLHLAHEGVEDGRTLRRPCHPRVLLARVASLRSAVSAGARRPDRG